MYKCRRCGHFGEEPPRVYEPDCISSAVCGDCGSDDIAVARVKCFICGRELYDGDIAYEADDRIICPACVTKVTI